MGGRARPRKLDTSRGIGADRATPLPTLPHKGGGIPTSRASVSATRRSNHDETWNSSRRARLTQSMRPNSSSTCPSRSLPKNISLPTKKVGMPKTPRATAASVLSTSSVSSSGRCARREQRARRRGPPRSMRRARIVGIVELQPLLPHAAAGPFRDRRRFAAAILRGDEAAHQLQRIDGKMRVEATIDKPVLGDEAADFQHLVVNLALDVGESDHRRAIVGRLEDAAEQARRDRPASRPCARGSAAARDRRDRRWGWRSRTGTRASGHGLTTFPPRAAGRARTSRRCAAGRAARRNCGRFRRACRISSRARRCVGVGNDGADEGAVDHAVDHDMRDMHALGAHLARQALRQRAQAVLGAGEGGKAGAAAQARRRAGEEDRAAPARSHHPRRLAAGEKAGEARHFPDFRIDLRRRLDDGKAHVGADVEDRRLRAGRPRARCARRARRPPPSTRASRPKARAAPPSARWRASASTCRDGAGRRVTQTVRPSRAKARAIAAPSPSPAPIAQTDALDLAAFAHRVALRGKAQKEISPCAR